MEPRRVLSANPVTVGAVYIEDDSGTDAEADTFYVSFEGGSETTRLGRVIINTSQDANDQVLSEPDVYFDTIANNAPENVRGSGGAQGFSVNSQSIGVSAADVSVQVVDGGTKIILDINDFRAGDVLVFSIDVDQFFTNKPDDQITSGIEFAGSQLETVFVDDHYNFNHVTGPENGVFQYSFDFGKDDSQDTGVLSGLPTTEYRLSSNNLVSIENRTAGALDQFELTPKPVTISGTVYHDRDFDLTQDAGEEGIAGVLLRLQRLDENGNYVDIPQGNSATTTTTTDANGDYIFDESLNLQPGTYRVLETQPSDFEYSVGEVPGTVVGSPVGTSSENVLAEITIPLGDQHAIDYDFAEAKAAQICGYVYHDRNDNGLREAGEEGIEGVQIRVVPINNTLGQKAVIVTTDANGFYCVEGLAPGEYEVIEMAQPNGYLDGKDTPGTVSGVALGNAVNPGDRIFGVSLKSGEAGVEYNFGEIKYASLSGYVYLANPEGDCVGPGHSEYRPIAGVEVRLTDTQGNSWTTVTDQNGKYNFTKLAPGTYTIVEVTHPDFPYLQGHEHVGTINGVGVGAITAKDTISQIALGAGEDGVRYDFCEHEAASVAGRVYHDRNDNGVQDSGEEGIGGVVVELYDDSGNLVRSTTTNANGAYAFNDLYAGTYRIVETQPVAYVDGRETLGNIAGSVVGSVSANDVMSDIRLLGGQHGVQYNFGEYKLGSIEGMVHADANGDCVFNPVDGDQPLEGVTIELLDGNGQVIATTLTDASGRYRFDGIHPGAYTIRQQQPVGYLQGGQEIGTYVGTGQTGTGDASTNLLSNILFASDTHYTDYNFCEVLPASISGNVYHDRNNNGQRESGDEGISGVLIQLYDANNNLVDSTFTDSQGAYTFSNLYPGTYRIHEVQPAEFVDGIDTAGTINGVTVGVVNTNDQIRQIALNGGQHGVEYNFGEYKLSTIEGVVHADKNGNCVLEESLGEIPLEGVTIQLTDAAGNVIATQLTDANGRYRFENLLPGTYSIREIQPDGYLQGRQHVGTYVGSGLKGTGDDATTDWVQGIVFTSDTHYTEYNFCEIPPGKISGYVFQDGATIRINEGQTLTPNQILARRDGQLTSDDTRLAGVVLELRDGITGLPIDGDQVLPGVYGTGPIRTVTDANGYYEFVGLPAGNYAVFEIHPNGYVDHVDTPGTTQGIAVNATNMPSQLLLDTLDSSVDPGFDAILRIAVGVGDHSQLNNFSEVAIRHQPTDVPPPNPPIPQLPPPVVQPLPGYVPPAEHTYAGALPVRPPGMPYFFSAGPDDYTWHLSVIDAGISRGQGETIASMTENVQNVGFRNARGWDDSLVDQGEWVISFNDASEMHRSFEGKNITFGLIDGIPVVGDFNGDGVDEVAMYRDGHWYLDLNGNGEWDALDLWARLGNKSDRPVVGDWDGDGKEDIGIFGPIWPGDPRAIENDPGLPDPDNMLLAKAKNVPPTVEEATHGRRVMRLTAAGSNQTDLIDHVFRYGEAQQVPITGDWNGDGIRTIGTYEKGSWKLDMDGDGRWTERDLEVTYGQAGDLPVIGDFNGDGVEEIGVFRNGKWILDTNNNRELDAHDAVFEMGEAGDLPLAGDFDGDGVDEPILYRAKPAKAEPFEG